MITIYAPDAQDFSTLGFGTLEPTKCTIEERAGGLYELVLRQPITDDNRAFLLAPNRIIKASAPIRETPEVTIGNVGTTTVVRDIWRVKTNGGRLHLRSKPNGHIIGAYPPGTEVVKYGESSVSGWWGVIVCDGGAKGYMYSQYLEHVGERSETISGDTPGEVIRPRQTREQLFRIYSVTNDSSGRFVEARAQHISYDLGSAVVTGTYKPESVPAATVCTELMARADHDPGINIICGVDGPITGDYTGKNLLECLLEPETGIAAQTGAKVIRDNFDIFLIADEPRTRDIEIRYGKNLLTASLMQDGSGVITRIYPVGRNADGEDLVGAPVDSLHINEYPVIRTAWMEYDVAVGKDMTEAQALAKLQELAEADFAAGCDLITAKLDADFVRLELANQYAALANQYALHMYDSVPVIDRGAGINATVRMVGYTYDVLLDRYTQTTLGDMSEIETTVYGYELANGSVGGSKIANNSVGGGKLRDLSVSYAKMSTAAIGQLSADAVVAIRADIRQLVSGQITTDQLYADLAAIAVAQITAANIEKANIQWAQIDTLLASIAEISRAEIDSADIDYAKIKDMVTNTAIITEGVSGQLYINRLAVTDANMVSLTTGELLLKNASGDFVRLTVDDAGNVKGTVVQVEGDNIAQNTVSGGNLIENTITARELNVASIFADSALIRAIKAANIDVADLFASSATIAALDNYILRTETIEALEGKLNVWAQDKIDLAVGDVQIGGTNLLRETGWYTEVATDWIKTNGGFIGYPYDSYPGQDDFYDNGFIHWTSTGGGDLWTPGISVKSGETYTLSFRHRGAGLEVHWYGENSSGVQTWGDPAKLYDNASTNDCAETRTIPENVARLNIVFRTTSGEAGVLGRIKLERGNKATAWSPNPLDNSRGVVNGSALRITPEAVSIETPVFSVNVSGTNGDMSISESGLAIDQINSPSVLKQYTGPTVLTITQYANELNGIDRFATLSDAFAKLSNCFLPYPVAITNGVPNLIEATATLQNTCGSYIQIYGNGQTFTGQINLDSVKTRIVVGNLNVQNGGGHPFVVSDCTYVRIEGCTVISARSEGTYYCGVDAYRSTLDFVNCSFLNCHIAIQAQNSSRVFQYNCLGDSNEYSIAIRDATILGMLVARPAADAGIYCDSSCFLSSDPGPGYVGGVAPPSPMTTVTLTATNSRTYGGGWYSGTNVLSQGVSGGTTFYGYMWFDLSSISGKTIKAASIRLYRRAGVGSGSAVKVYIGSHNASGPSGSLNMVSNFDNQVIGTAGQKETINATIPTEAAQQLASGSATGLFVHSTSSGYAQFDGYDGSVPPQLTVTYE